MPFIVLKRPFTEFLTQNPNNMLIYRYSKGKVVNTMKKIKDFIVKYGNPFAKFAFAFNIAAIGFGCHYFFHEPEVPKELMEYKKNE